MLQITIRDLIHEFEWLAGRALRLESVSATVFRSVYLWTPSLSRATYGGQLIAHSAEAAYRTVDTTRMAIHSLRLNFLSPGRSDCGEPVVYTVKLLRTGRSFCTRMIIATQESRKILVAVVSFHCTETSGLEHQNCKPFRGSEFLSQYVRDLEDTTSNTTTTTTTTWDSPHPVPAAAVQYLNLSNLKHIRATTPWDVWMRVASGGMPLLLEESGIPLERLHIIAACWLSDFILAFAALLPHGMPNLSLRLITSLDQTIYFHHPECVRLDEWFLYEVQSSWACGNRGLNEGRMYGQDGKLWISTTQETLLRMKDGYISKV